MNPVRSRIIGLKQLIYQLYQTDLRSEFFDKEKTGIGRKIAAVEIYSIIKKMLILLF